MKAIKRIIPGLLALCLLLALGAPALAEEAGGDERFRDKSLDQVLDEFLEEYQVDRELIALGYYNTVTGEEAYVNADQYMVSGSMYKVPLNMYFAEMVYEGEIDWDTKFAGIKYETLLRETIINSSNDYAAILWKEMGDGVYRRYRELIAPYMGEDAATVDEKYYENNFFTPRQVISCLKLLYSERERFPQVIETMQQAEPENYFKLSEQRFDIAHKYGYYLTDYHLYMADCGIAFTDEPILLVLFSDNISNVYQVMTAYCTLMCDYTQYHADLRRQAAEAEAKAQAEQAREEGTEALIQKVEAEDAAETGEAGGSSALIPAGLSLLATVLALLAVLLLSRRYRIKLAWAVLAVLLTGAALALSIVGMSAGVLISRAEGDPEETSLSFLDALSAGNYEKAGVQLAGYTSLGLETPPEGQAAALMHQALRESYSYELRSDCVADKLEAKQLVALTYLDLNAVQAAAAERTVEELKALVRDRPSSQVYDEDKNYLPEITQEAYKNAVSAVLRKAEDYYVTAELELSLSYGDGKWSLVPDEALLDAVSGGSY